MMVYTNMFKFKELLNEKDRYRGIKKDRNKYS